MKLLVSGYYGAGNLGDELMLYCLREWLARQAIAVTVLSAYPDEVRRLHGLDAVEDVPLLGEWSWKHAWGRGVAWRVIRALRRHDALVIGGGDLIRDDLGWRPFLAVIEKAIVALLLGRDVYLINVGIGEPRTRYGRALLGWVLRRASRIVVRDPRSVDVCAGLGAGARVESAPDVVFSLPALAGNAPARDGPPYALVCLRGTANVFGQFEWSESRLRALAAGLDGLAERHGLRIVFLPFQTTEAGGDDKLHHRVAMLMRNRERAAALAWSADPHEAASWFRGSSMVVAMRLHAAVLAAAYGRPCVLMPYDRKVTEFARQFPPAAIVSSDALDRGEFAEALERAAAAGPTAVQGADFWASERLTRREAAGL